ncbi:MAG: globin domain-containing protein [Phycisphaerales bacterium]
MDMKHRELVLTSYEALSADLEVLVTRFYNNLFKVAPAARDLFPGDPKRQHQHFAAAIAMLARNVMDIEAMDEPLRDLGRRHLAYRVLPEHYELARKMLVETLAECAGDRWTPEHTKAWEALIARTAQLMLHGTLIEARQQQ